MVRPGKGTMCLAAKVLTCSAASCHSQPGWPCRWDTQPVVNVRVVNSGPMEGSDWAAGWERVGTVRFALKRIRDQ